MFRRGAKGEYLESPEEKQERLDFEASHGFKMMDQVIILKTIIDNKHSPCPYKGQVAKVCRVLTEPGTGPCIRIKYGGNGINIFAPNEELCFDDKISRYLYT